jgi:hypothetical protein
VHRLGELPEGIAGEVRIPPPCSDASWKKANTSSTAIGIRSAELAGSCGLNSFVTEGSTRLSVPNRVM